MEVISQGALSFKLISLKILPASDFSQDRGTSKNPGPILRMLPEILHH